MSFLNPFFLFGVAALGVPVLVHLVRRTRARRVQFPALMFVRQVPQRTIRRRTLQNWLLLLLRCLAILLVVIAFSRPFFSGRSSAKQNGSGGATVILLDTSLSMRRDQLFAQAQRRALATLDETPNDEQLSLVIFSKRYELVNRFSTDKTRIRSAIAAVSAGWEGTDYEQALRGAEALLSQAETSGKKRIILISDFQAVGWNRPTSTFKLGDNIELKTLDVGPDPTANVAVTNVEARGLLFGQKYSDNLTAHISNFSDSPRDGVQVDFQINEQTVEKRSVNLNARETKVIEFSGFNLNEGANRCVIQITTADFAPDNRFYFTLNRTVPAKALIIESAARGRSDSFFLQSALSANNDLPFTFTLKTTGAVDPAVISEYALVILNDAGSPSPSLNDSLTRFVEAGGQLIISTGPHTQTSSLDGSLQRVMPVTLREAIQTKAGETIAITDVKFDHPIFEVFRSSGRLSTARVFGYFRSEPKPNAVVLAHFEDASPALIEARVGQGRVLFFTTSLGPTWNDLALTPLYLPFVHQMVRYAGQRDESPWYSLSQILTVRRRTQVAAPAVDTPSGVRLTENQVTQDGDLLVTAREPGFYRLRYDTGQEFAAVDLDATEGDFTKLNFQEFVSGVTGGSAGPESNEASRKTSNEELEGRQKVWWSLLLLAFLLLLTESVIARRTKIARMVVSARLLET